MENWDPSANDEEDDGSPQAEMGVDGDHLNQTEPDKERKYEVEVDEEHGGDSADDGSDDEDNNSGDVAMVPMADTLNARFGCNNVR